MTFFQKGSPMVFVQKCLFFSGFFLGNIGQENVYNEKTPVLGFKNKKFKKSKNWYFPKGVSAYFWSENGHFSNFFFRQYRKENVSYDIQEQKNAFRGYKNIKFKKSKMNIFPKGLINGFGRKIAIFPTFFFRQYTPGKCLLWYSSTKKRLSRL